MVLQICLLEFILWRDILFSGKTPAVWSAFLSLSFFIAVQPRSVAWILPLVPEGWGWHHPSSQLHWLQRYTYPEGIGWVWFCSCQLGQGLERWSSSCVCYVIISFLNCRSMNFLRWGNRHILFLLWKQNWKNQFNWWSWKIPTKFYKTMWLAQFWSLCKLVFFYHIVGQSLSAWILLDAYELSKFSGRINH